MPSFEAYYHAIHLPAVKKMYIYVLKKSIELPVRQEYKDPTLNAQLDGLLDSPLYFSDNNNDDNGS